MRSFLLVGTFMMFVPRPSFASDLNFRCAAREEGTSQKDDFIQFSTHEIGPEKYYLGPIQYIHRDLGTDGNYVERSEDIYSQSNRGGYNVTYCNPNDNEFSETTGKFDLYSVCTTPSGDAQRVNLLARFSTLEEGYIRISVFGRSGHIERRIVVAQCQLTEFLLKNGIK